MITFETAKALVTLVLARGGYEKIPPCDPGPASDTLKQKVNAGAMIFLTTGGGAGLSVEGLWDSPFLTTRVVSGQNDYAGGEKLAWDLDTALLALDAPQTIVNGVIIAPITRSGGGPQLLTRDVANRYHFPCSYIVETPAGS